MKKIFSFSIVLFGGFALAFSQSAEEGKRYLEIENFEKAKKTFTNLYKASPSADNAYLLGNYYYTINKSDTASTLFQEGLKKDPKNPMNYVGMGKVLFANNKTEAKNNFEMALKLADSKNTEVPLSIAKFYISTDKLEVPEAFKLLDNVANVAPKNPEVHVVRGDGYLKISDPNKAVTEYEEALKLNPSYSKALVRLGDIYQRVSNNDLALQYYQKAITADSLYAPAYREAGDANYKKKDYDKSFTYYKKFASLADLDENTAVKYGYFLLLKKDYKKALTTLQPFEKKEKVTPSINRYLAYAYYENNDYDKGLENIRTYWDKAENKNFASSDYEYYGKLLMKKDQDSLAVVNFEKALQIDSNKVDLYSELGNEYLILNKLDKAENILAKKVAKKSTPSDLFSLGKVYYYNKKYAQADTTFGTLINQMPNFAQGYLWKAKTKANMDPDSKQGLAKPYYEKFISLTKGDVEKNKKEIINSYDYLGYYYLLHNDKTKAKESYMKIKELDPTNKRADDGIKIATGAKSLQK